MSDPNEAAKSGSSPASCSPLKNGWFQGDPPENGQYLRAFDQWDDEEDADLYEYRDGKWYRDGDEWFCYGGVWKPASSANGQSAGAEPAE